LEKRQIAYEDAKRWAEIREESLRLARESQLLLERALREAQEEESEESENVDIEEFSDG